MMLNFCTEMEKKHNGRSIFYQDDYNPHLVDAAISDAISLQADKALNILTTRCIRKIKPDMLRSAVMEHGCNLKIITPLLADLTWKSIHSTSDMPGSDFGDVIWQWIETQSILDADVVLRLKSCLGTNDGIDSVIRAINFKFLFEVYIYDYES